MQRFRALLLAAGVGISVVLSPSCAMSARSQADLGDMPICKGGKRISCVVDGDTIWLDGEKIRLEGFNAPEIQGSCARESALARNARDLLQELLSGRSITIERSGLDRYGRTLATIRANGRDVGDIMIGESLAHVWRGRKENWCG